MYIIDGNGVIKRTLYNKTVPLDHNGWQSVSILCDMTEVLQRPSRQAVPLDVLHGIHHAMIVVNEISEDWVAIRGDGIVGYMHIKDMVVLSD